MTSLNLSIIITNVEIIILPYRVLWEINVIGKLTWLSTYQQCGTINVIYYMLKSIYTWLTFKYRKLFLKFWNFHCSTRTSFRQSFYIHTCIQSLKHFSQITIFLLSGNQKLAKDSLRDAGKCSVFWRGCDPSTTAVPSIQSHKFHLKINFFLTTTDNTGYFPCY